jgi:thioredoxin reductase
MNNKTWDVIIVGGGPAGCSAAIVLARSNRKVLIIDAGEQRNLRSHGIRNYLTRDGITPTEYLSIAHAELEEYKVPIHKNVATTARKLADKGFEIKDKEGNTFLCRRLLLATGVKDKIPGVPGMKELWGSHVFHCPFCDGWECREGKIAIYAPKQNGYGMALALKHLCKEVVLLTDGARYLSSRQRKILEAQKISVISTKLKELIHRDGQLTHIALEKGSPIDCQHVFVLHKHHVNDTLLEQLDCKRSKLGAAIINRYQQTNVMGVYVAGDAAFDMHLVIMAAAEGAKAAVAIHNDLLKTDMI